LLLREEGPIPPRRIVVFVGGDPHADLALLMATRMSTAWRAELSVISLLPPDTPAEDLETAELDLAEEMTDYVRASFSSASADSPQALVRAHPSQPVELWM